MDLAQGASEQAAPVVGQPGAELAAPVQHLTLEEVAAQFPDPAPDGERLAGIKKAMKKTLSKRGEHKPKAPRPAVTYRAQRRNEAKAKKKAMYRIGEDVKEGWSPAVELNRSQNWIRAQTYGYAREISPVPERPVR
ncbi:hypothetical protein ACKWRH_21430 [Bradyrhizobium sp. Pa8]|uniref:hypothetical protein n=1 Tax=Bradyrhizobium sp. Pa8 TaxID=3386552 RepID=UPI00403F1040